MRLCAHDRIQICRCHLSPTPCKLSPEPVDYFHHSRKSGLKITLLFIHNPQAYPQQLVDKFSAGAQTHVLTMPKQCQDQNPQVNQLNHMPMTFILQSVAKECCITQLARTRHYKIHIWVSTHSCQWNSDRVFLTMIQSCSSRKWKLRGGMEPVGVGILATATPNNQNSQTRVG